MDPKELAERVDPGGGVDLSNPEESCTIWMGDVDSTMTEVFIAQAFAEYGEAAESVNIILNKQTRQPEGYCFVRFHNASAAHKAMLKLNGKVISKTKPVKRFRLNFASFGREHLSTPEYSLHVSELSKEVDDLDLYAAFSLKYKNVRSAKVMTDSEGRSRSYGFVRFAEQSEMQRALLEMQHAPGVGKNLIKVHLAQPKRPGPGGAPSLQPDFSGHWSAEAAHWDAWQRYYSWYYAQPGAQHMQPPYDYYAYCSQNPGVFQTDEYVDDSPEDPELIPNVDAENFDFISRSEELYRAVRLSSDFAIDDASVTLEQVVLNSYR